MGLVICDNIWYLDDMPSIKSGDELRQTIEATIKKSETSTVNFVDRDGKSYLIDKIKYSMNVPDLDDDERPEFREQFIMINLYEKEV